MEGKKLSQDQIESILQAYVMSENVEDISKALGFRRETIKKYLDRYSDRVRELQEIKKREYEIDFSNELRKRNHMLLKIIDAYGNHALEPEVVAAASGRDSIVVVGTAIDKGRIINAKEQIEDTKKNTGVVILAPIEEAVNECSMETTTETS